MTTPASARGKLLRAAVLILIAAFFSAQYWIAESPSLMGSTPASLGIVTLVVASALVSPSMSVTLYCATVVYMFSAMRQAPGFLPWACALGLLLLAVNSLPAINPSRTPGVSSRALLLKRTLALAAVVLYAGFATLPAMLANGTAQKFLELIGATALLMQVAPLLMLLPWGVSFPKLSVTRGRPAENYGWWALTSAVFVYVGVFGDQWTILGLVDGIIFIAPLMVWAALRLSYASVATAVLLVPLVSGGFQQLGIGGTPAPYLVLGTSGVTMLSSILVFSTWGLFGWRHWILRRTDGPDRFSLRSTALSTGSLLVAGLVTGFMLVQQSNWQTDFVVNRFSKEAVRILEHIEGELNGILDSTSSTCTFADLASLNDKTMGTAFVLYFGLINGAGEEMCSSGSGISYFVELEGIPEGLSYLFPKEPDVDGKSIILAVRRPGGITAYALLDMPSVIWYLQGFIEDRREAVSLKIDEHAVFNHAPDAGADDPRQHQKTIFNPYFLLEARITGGREVIASTVTPMAAIILAAFVIVFIITVLVGELRARERAAKQKAEAESKVRSEFLAIMSHEIRTPLNGLVGNLELLQLESKKKRVPEGKVKSAALDDAFTSSRALLAIINDVLDMSKIEAGGMTLNLRPTDLQEVISSTVKTHAVTARGKGLKLDTDYSLNLSKPIVADPIRLQQILSNLVSNAVKFTEKGGVALSVTEHARSPDGVVILFSVQDTGWGIEEEFLPHLFDPFYQAHRDEHSKGTGLGLSICNSLVTLMGGCLQVDSTPGEGTRFYFTLFFPYAEENERATLASGIKALYKRRKPRGDFTRLPVLIVDDHPLTLELLSRQLELLGLNSRRATGMADAIARLEAEGPFSGIITDENMPGGNGTDLAKAVRRKERGTVVHLPIVLCTADLTAKLGSLIDNGTLDGVLFKPYDLAGLEACLRPYFALTRMDSQATPPGEQGTSEEVGRFAWENGDTSSLLMTVGNDWNDAAAMLDKLYVTTDADILVLARCLSAGDAEGVVKVAHRIKGASQIIGASRLARAARAIEGAAKANDLVGCKGLLREIVDANEDLHDFARRIGA